MRHAEQARCATSTGAIVCRRDEGNAKTFQCFYHAWTFDNCGKLLGFPDEEGYAMTAFDRSKMGLGVVERHESYRDFHFVCFDRSAPPLVDYLAGARESLDLIPVQMDRILHVVGLEDEFSKL